MQHVGRLLLENADLNMILNYALTFLCFVSFTKDNFTDLNSKAMFNHVLLITQNHM